MGPALTAVVSFLISAVAIRLSLPLLTQVAGVADTNERTMHTGSIPKGAGAPMLASAFFAAGVTSSLPVVIALLAGALAVVSLVNDRAHVPAAVRFPVHLAVALAYVLSLPPDVFVFQGLAPFALDRLAAAILLSWMMNLFNFMDGINGIAGTEAIAIAIGFLAVLTLYGGADPAMAALAASLAGAAAGFLVWNLRRTALVFLGDAGSVPLGFLTGALMIDLAIKGFWAAALILPLYFLVDATSTLLTRLVRGERFWEAHRSHAYQRAARALDSHLAVVALIAAANAALIALAIFSGSRPWTALAFASVIVATLMIALNRVAAAPIRSSGNDPSRQ